MDGLEKRIINKAIEDPSDLTEWEYDFVFDIADKPETYTLTKKQREILFRIWDKIAQ